MDVLLILILVLFVFGGAGGPWWGYHSYGWGPTGLLWLIAVVCLAVWLVRRARVL
jgi:hypothetical protein